MIESPLLSIIIPTRNRQKYAISAITSILSISAPELELVVQDNSDSNDIEDYIRKNVNDTRLRYNYTSTPQSFVDNFNAAVILASGRYLCIIGDDDGINPEIIEATHWAEMNDVDALIPLVSAVYIWPESGIKTSLGGVLTIRQFSADVTISQPEKELKKLIKHGGLKYLDTKIPRLYHGIVKYNCMDQVRKKTGAFFGGLSPDIYSAIAIANFAKKVICIDYPLTIDGISKSSGSAQSVRGEHVGNIQSAPHFRYRGNYEWSEIIPRFYSVETIWADSAIAAIKALGQDDLLQDFNFPFLAAYCIAAHPRYMHIVLHDMYKYFRATNKSQLVGTAQFCYFLLIVPSLRLIKLIHKGFEYLLLRPRKRITGIKDMVEAANLMTDYLKNNNKRFSDFISMGYS